MIKEKQEDKYVVGDRIKVYLSYRCGENNNEFGARVCKVLNHQPYKDSIFFRDEQELLIWIFQHRPNKLKFVVNFEDEKAEILPDMICKLSWYNYKVEILYRNSKFKVLD